MLETYDGLGERVILLWGLAQDTPLAAVRQSLHRLGCPVVFLDQREVLTTEVELVVDSDIRGILRTKNQTMHLEPDGRWYCFEINPSPAFPYYQMATNQPMDEAIARLLVAGSG